MARPTPFRLRVFLLEFEDVAAPPEYSPRFVHELLFGGQAPGTSPPPDRSPVVVTARQFFHQNSDGRVVLEGHVEDWVQAPRPAAETPHWNGDTQQSPLDTDQDVYYASVGPLVLAWTLTAHGLTSDQIRSDLQAQGSPASDSDVARELVERLMTLPDGHRADGLVFLHNDLRVGGGKRDGRGLARVMSAWAMPNVINRFMEDGQTTWASLWDPAWNAVPECLITTIVVPPDNPEQLGPDGTCEDPSPAPDSLVLSPVEVLMHELGHLITDAPDLYGAEHGPWDGFALMHGVRGHFSQPVGSYVRHLAGWMDYADLDRRRHLRLLPPFETHNECLRVPNGPPGTEHSLCLENRDDILWHRDTDPRDAVSVAWSEPPASRGRGLLCYRRDDRGEASVSGNADGVRRRSGVVRTVSGGRLVWHPSSGGTQAWAQGRIPTEPDPEQRGDHLGSTRNALGELWWEVADVSAGDDGDLELDLRSRALDVVGEAHRAPWERPQTSWAVDVTLDAWTAWLGHVMMVDETRTIGGQVHGRALELRPPWQRGGDLLAEYDLSRFADAPLRLYLELAVPNDDKDCDAMRITVERDGVGNEVLVGPGQIVRRCWDFPPGSGPLTLRAHGSSTQGEDVLYVLSGYVVERAPEVVDLVRNAVRATWASEKGPFDLNTRVGALSTASLRGPTELEDGWVYGPGVIVPEAGTDAEPFVTATWEGLTLPKGGCFLRGRLGLVGDANHQGSVTVRVVARDTGSSDEEVLVDGMLVHADHDERQLHLECFVPEGATGSTRDLELRMDFSEDANQRLMVCWTSLELVEG